MVIDYRTCEEKDLPLEVPLDSVKFLHIEMGYQCNYRCTFCYQVDFSAKQNMQEEIWRERLAEMYPNLEWVDIQGGEPTIMKNCIGLRDYLVENHPQVKLGLTTNGLRFNEPWADIMTRQGHALYCSVNAATEATYKIFMKYGKWGPVIANLRRLVELRSERQSPLKISLSFVIIPENVHELADFIEFVHDMGCDEARFLTDRHVSVADDDHEKVLGFIDAAYGAAERHPELSVTGLQSFEQMYLACHHLEGEYAERVERCLQKRACSLCRVPWFEVYVRHDGSVYFCCMTYKKIGDLNESDIGEIWNSPTAHRFRRSMLRDKFTFCSPSCLSNRKPNYGLKQSAFKFLNYLQDDPDLAIQKAKAKVKKVFSGKARL